MKSDFYDIESLKNVFTLANFQDPDNHVDIYYLIDNPELIPDNFLERATKVIHEDNKNFNGTVAIYDLLIEENVHRLAQTFGMSDSSCINNPDLKSSYADEFRIVCDTDPEYNEDLHPYFFGYNSDHYDTTMLAWFLYNSIDEHNGKFYPQTAKMMRQFNDELFSAQFKDRMEDRLRFAYKNPLRPSAGYTAPNYRTPPVLIRKNMLMSGRHIDVSNLNEKQSKVGLKRILGMIGCQILESDKLRPGQDEIETTEQLLDLFAYNVSDVVNLKKLRNHKSYDSGFKLKKQLLKTYPELVYKQKADAYAPDISQKTVRPDRLIISSSSAQFSTKSLCPYGHLHDYDTVSFMYPSEAKSKALGIPRVNVLEEARKFFYNNFAQPELRAKFDAIYNYYKWIEGKNFNSSKNYLVDHGVDPDSSTDPESFLDDALKVHQIGDIEPPNTCLYYFHKDGSPSTCFANFSVGGIHGAEYNMELYKADLEAYQDKYKAWQEKVDLFDKVKAMYPNPCDLKAAKSIMIDGVKYTPSTFLRPKATVKEAYYKDPPDVPEPPILFKKQKTATGKITYNVDKRYTYTSSSMSNHEDFTSYYPNLLRMMDAFFNPGLGYDRYGEIFDQKTEYGKLMKDKSKPEDERGLFAVMREGTKLILNSASGAADANFDSNIRMNNKIISMRIIGQLFTWRIGQAQTIEGSSIISTNTDGLYSVLEAERNNEILARESASIHVDIEPEPIYLISKDSNNRLEIEVEDGQLTEIVSASGGTLACRKGPTPTKSLAHPAIIDWALAEYLLVASVGYKGLSLSSPFDDNVGRSIIASARGKFSDDIHTLLMFQNIVASSPGSQRFVFATSDDSETALPLQHYNRCFIAKDKTPGAYHLKTASARKITEATRKKRNDAGERAQQHDPVAAEILAVNGIKAAALPVDKEAAVAKIPGIEDSWYIYVNNSDLYYMTQNEIDDILDNLDYNKYLALLHDTFENNWRNMTPEWERIEAEAKSAKKKTSISESDTSGDSQKDSACGKVADDATSTNSAETLTNNAKSTDESDACPEGDIPPLSECAVPKMTRISKTLLSPLDIYNGEHHLCMHGVRAIDAHKVLADMFKIMTDTDIDN